MTTLADALQELHRLQHRKAIWDALMEHLRGGFIDDKVGKVPAEAKITVVDCTVSEVAQDTIFEFIEEHTNGTMKNLDTQIARLMEGAFAPKKEEKSGGNDTPNKAPAKKKTAKGRRPTGN